MREDLAREFPEAVRAAAWTRGRIGRGPRLQTEPVLWAAISAVGAGFLVGAVAQALVGVTSLALVALKGPALTLYPVTTIAGSAAAAAVALGVRGPAALLLYLAYVALGIALNVPGLVTFCERSGGAGFPLPGPDQCTAAGFVVSLWPQLVGIGTGIAVARAIMTGGDGINSVLRIAGSFAVALFVMGHLWSATIAQTTSILTSGLTLAAGTVAASVAAGVIAAQLPRGIRSAAAVAGVWLVPWLTLQLPLVLQGPPPTPADYALAMTITVVAPPVAAAFLMLSAVVAARGRFIPRDAA